VSDTREDPALHELDPTGRFSDRAADYVRWRPGYPAATGRFTPARLETFAHAQQLDRVGLLGRAASASYVPKQGAAFERLARLLGALHERHRDGEGRVTLRYVTEVFLAERT
jgi:hypothetical protein